MRKSNTKTKAERAGKEIKQSRTRSNRRRKTRSQKERNEVKEKFWNNKTIRRRKQE